MRRFFACLVLSLSTTCAAFPFMVHAEEMQEFTASSSLCDGAMLIEHDSETLHTDGLTKISENDESDRENSEANKNAESNSTETDKKEDAGSERLNYKDKTLEAAEEDKARIAAEKKESLRQRMVQFALQFVGNPYVWGGTSLTNGADCSGFVMSVYANFGIGLPRVACDQANAGRRISVSEAKPGDLLFYQDKSGYVYHVTMYIGDGRVVEAANKRVGIITSGVGGAAFGASIID